MFKKTWQKIFHFHPADRGNYVVYLILLVFLFVAIGCDIALLATQLVLKGDYQGVPIYFSLFLTFLIFLAAVLFRKGYTKLINELFLLFLLFAYSNIAFNAGTKNEFGLFIMVIYIIVSAISLKGKKFFLSIVLLLLTFFAFSILETERIILINLVNRTDYANAISITMLLSMIIFISWLFNREINNYISQLRESKKLLQQERDMLEVKVEERTRQLQEQQMEKIAEFSKFAEFGRLAQGLFHDLINPLTALSLNLHQIKKGSKESITELTKYINGANQAANNMEKLIHSTRRYFTHRVEKITFLMRDELDELFQIIHYKADKAGVKLVFEEDKAIKISGNRMRFSQLMSNLILNAIEAHEHSRGRGEKSQVVISARTEKDNVIISVKDSAGGISESNIKKIFQPFFSTKSERGNIGIGLTMCRDIVETDFLGEIEVKSSQGIGTEFIIKIPDLAPGSFQDE